MFIKIDTSRCKYISKLMKIMVYTNLKSNLLIPSRSESSLEVEKARLELSFLSYHSHFKVSFIGTLDVQAGGGGVCRPPPSSCFVLALLFLTLSP